MVNLLTRPELDDLILVEELNILRDTSKLRESIGEMLEKSNQSPYKGQDDAELDENERAASNELNRRKAMNFEKIGDRSV